MPDILGVTVNEDGDLVVAFQTVVPTGDSAAVAAELDSQEWLDKLANQLEVETVKPIAEPTEPGTELVTGALTIASRV